MNFLQHVTFTGLDEETNILDLLLLARSAGIGNVEIGILYSEKLAGKNPRYPSYEFVKKIGELAGRSQMPFMTSLHLCGKAARDIINYTAEENLYELVDLYKNLQLNFRVDDSDPDFNTEVLQKRVANMVCLDHKHKFIVQDHAPNHKLCTALANYPPTCANILFDCSGGNGVVPETWPKSHPGIFCGYAGGLNPDNKATEIVKIQTSLTTNETCFIDMESGVRTDNKFDLQKVEQVLNLVKPYFVRGVSSHY